LKDPIVISAIEKTGLTYANLKQQDYQKFLDAEEARLHRLLTSTPPSVYDCRLRGKDGDFYGAQAKAA
jgi:hypothetical protein